MSAPGVQPVLAFEAESEVMARTLQLARESNTVAEATAPRDRVSSSEALNSPFNAAELVAAVQVATIIFKGGAAALGFLTGLVTLLREMKKTIDVFDPSSGKRIGTISANTSEKDLRRWLGL